MRTESLSPGLAHFIQQHIQSIRQLEVLLLLHATPTKEWTAEKVARDLCSNETSTLTWLEIFRSQGLLTSAAAAPLSFRYDPSRPELAEMVSQLAQEYKIRPLKVIDVFLAQPATKMMNFMEAFKIKKESKDDDS